MGKDDEILARVDLQIAGEEDATYDRTWPLIAEEFCIATRVDLPRDVRRMAETQSVRVSLTPLRRNYGETARSQLMDVRASWRIGYSIMQALSDRGIFGFVRARGPYQFAALSDALWR